MDVFAPNRALANCGGWPPLRLAFGNADGPFAASHTSHLSRAEKMAGLKQRVELPKWRQLRSNADCPFSSCGKGVARSGEARGKGDGCGALGDAHPSPSRCARHLFPEGRGALAGRGRVSSERAFPCSAGEMWLEGPERVAIGSLAPPSPLPLVGRG